MDLELAKKQIDEAVYARQMLMVIGNCYVEYWGRAASKLPNGKRMLLIKGDNSIGLHQNRKLRPVNYMMGAVISSDLSDGTLKIKAEKPRPKEVITVFFNSVHGIHAYEMDDQNDLMLFGSEREISGQLMTDLSFLEKGLKPIKSELPMRKGTIDIVAEDKDGKLVVIEVKRRKASFNAVTQLQRYMKDVEKMKGKETRGILVAPDIMKNAKEMLEEAGLEFCQLDFEIGNPKCNIKGLNKKQPTLKEYISSK